MFVYNIQAILIMVQKTDFSNHAVLYLFIKIFISHDKILLPWKEEFTIPDKI